MNRRDFFRTVGIPVLAWPIAKQIRLPGNYLFQPSQIIKKGNTWVRGHINFDKDYNIKNFQFLLSCPNCAFKENAYVWVTFSHKEVEPYCSKMITHSIWEINCPKCGFKVRFKFSPTAEWKEIDYSKSLAIS